jgi:hypothetical protein
MEETRFGVTEGYSSYMEPYFNPFQVMGQVMYKMDIEKSMIKTFSVRFNQDRESGINFVTVNIELDFPISNDWIEHMKYRLGKLMKDAFYDAYKGVGNEVNTNK